MTTTAEGIARVAAQLREAARDVALVAERRTRSVPQPETAQRGAGTAYITDSGTLTWACGYGGETTVGVPPRGEERPDGDPESATARVMSRTVIHAMVKAGLTSGTKETRRSGELA